MLIVHSTLIDESDLYTLPVTWARHINLGTGPIEHDHLCILQRRREELGCDGHGLADEALWSTTMDMMLRDHLPNDARVRVNVTWR